MSLASAFSLSHLSADLTYDWSSAPEVPEEIAVLWESPNADTVPVHYVFAQVET